MAGIGIHCILSVSVSVSVSCSAFVPSLAFFRSFGWGGRRGVVGVRWLAGVLHEMAWGKKGQNGVVLANDWEEKKGRRERKERRKRDEHNLHKANAAALMHSAL